MDATAQKLREAMPNSDSRELVELIFAQPDCRIGNVTEARIAQRATASKLLKERVKLDILMETPVGREKLFLNLKLMRILTGDRLEPVGYFS